MFQYIPRQFNSSSCCGEFDQEKNSEREREREGGREGGRGREGEGEGGGGGRGRDGGTEGGREGGRESAETNKGQHLHSFVCIVFEPQICYYMGLSTCINLYKYVQYH